MLNKLIIYFPPKTLRAQTIFLKFLLGFGQCLLQMYLVYIC